MPRERAQSPSACGDTREGAAYVAAYLSDTDDCTHKLRRPRSMRNASLLVQLTEKTVEHRDGSEDYPIILPAIKKYNGEVVSELLIRLGDGSLAAWNLGNFTGRKKLVLENGKLKLADDLLPDLFAGEICEGTCNDVDAGLGVKMMVDNCPGQPTVTRYQIVRIPKCCCAESTPLEDCADNLYVDEVLATGDISLAEPTPPSE